jgi:hypothetical protein
MWLRRLRFERKCHKDWRDRARKIEEIWRKKHDEELYIPIWWECVNISHVGCYSNQPVPDVRPRNEAHNPTMRKVAKVIQLTTSPSRSALAASRSIRSSARTPRKYPYSRIRS